MSDLTFEEIVAEVDVKPLWSRLFDEAEQELLADRPEDFDIEDIGRAAWARLASDGERDAALDALFYAYWSVVMAEQEELARHEKAREESLLRPQDVRGLLLDLSVEAEGRSVSVDRYALRRVLGEVERLQGRVELLERRPEGGAA
ncbi:hypothetical protein [Streptomyces spectabilis]|nr:hypothetical protein [Streptomyces spectabilis]MBB5108393.1 phage terminase large subunit GpA-like protein [Streptomyces spectabilis]MCI3901147.1 hypothetical protein [Streptomyces spectabilis]GGV46250.1 hypothetical protein GCM10010245_72560 [Streptomyces spectabilis]